MLASTILLWNWVKNEFCSLAYLVFPHWDSCCLPSLCKWNLVIYKYIWFECEVQGFKTGLTETYRFSIPRTSRFLSARQPGWQKLTNFQKLVARGFSLLARHPGWQKPTIFWYLVPRGFSQPGNRAGRNRPIFKTLYLMVSHCLATGLTEADRFL